MDKQYYRGVAGLVDDYVNHCLDNERYYNLNLRDFQDWVYGLARAVDEGEK